MTLGRLLIEVETEKPLGVAVYLEETLKQMKKNKFLSISNYKIKTEDEKAFKSSMGDRVNFELS